ncbi:rod shape-determining protein RodA [Bacteroidia bacterium]|nr:rod shape-determining protein RodA [Bacteroidia bacterium]
MERDFFNKIFRGDRVIWVIFMFLCLISIVEVYSASATLTFRTDYWNPILRHSMFLLIGLGIVLAVHAIPPRFFSVLGICLPVVCVLLIATRIFGTAVNGSYRWIEIAGITFQPSEIAKLCLITFTAFVLSKKKENENDDKLFKWIMGATLVTCGIIVIDNGSTAIMLFMIIFVMLIIGQISWKNVGKLALFLLAAAVILFCIIRFVPAETMRKVLPRAETWTERFKDFGKEEKNVHNPDFKIDDDNYQVSHANIAISNGRILGKLPGNSTERDFLPQAYSDFIYAIIIEELGLIGGLFILSLYIIFFIRAGIIANRTDKLFLKYLVIGSSLIIVTQALANMAVAVGLIPVTGQTLPLVSRGGTSTLITCIYFGIILGVSQYENPKGEQREKEIEEEFIEEKQAAESAEQEKIVEVANED